MWQEYFWKTVERIEKKNCSPELVGWKHVCLERWGNDEEYQRKANKLSFCERPYHISLMDKVRSLRFKAWPVLIVDETASCLHYCKGCKHMKHAGFYLHVISSDCL